MAGAHVTWRENGAEHAEHHADPSDLIRRLVATGADLTTLTISRPTLEDTYLSLIGASK